MSRGSLARVEGLEPSRGLLNKPSRWSVSRDFLRLLDCSSLQDATRREESRSGSHRSALRGLGGIEVAESSITAYRVANEARVVRLGGLRL